MIMLHSGFYVNLVELQAFWCAFDQFQHSYKFMVLQIEFNLTLDGIAVGTDNSGSMGTLNRQNFQAPQFLKASRQPDSLECTLVLNCPI
jgi:hypothetical protein